MPAARSPGRSSAPGFFPTASEIPCMVFCARSWLIMVVSCLTVAAVGVTFGTDLSGPDPWAGDEPTGPYLRRCPVDPALEARDATVLGRIAAKQALVDGVIAGRVGLMEAAARFRALNAGEPAYGGVIRTSYPGASDEESYCRNVIGFVAAQLKWDD